MRIFTGKCPACGKSLRVHLREKTDPIVTVNLKPVWDAMDGVWKAMDGVFKDLRGP